MVKAQEELGFTPESTIHLWSTPRRNQKKPSKDELIQELYTVKALVGLDFRLMSVADLVSLVAKLPTVKLVKFTEANLRTKMPYIEHLSPLNLASLSKLPLGTLKGLVEYLNERV